MSRPLRDIPNGSSVLADANVLVYALTPQSQFHASDRDLLECSAHGTVQLFTTVAVAADVLHRAMVLEVKYWCKAKCSAPPTLSRFSSGNLRSLHNLRAIQLSFAIFEAPLIAQRQTSLS